jgi:hypothetical protein
MLPLLRGGQASRLDRLAGLALALQTSAGMETGGETDSPIIVLLNITGNSIRRDAGVTHGKAWFAGSLQKVV